MKNINIKKSNATFYTRKRYTPNFPDQYRIIIWQDDNSKPRMSAVYKCFTWAPDHHRNDASAEKILRHSGQQLLFIRWKGQHAQL